MTVPVPSKCEYTLLWPLLLLIPMLVVSLLEPIGFISVVLGVGLLVAGIRYPVGVASAVIVTIPIVDQAIADSDYAGLFGAFRITPGVALKAAMSVVALVYLLQGRVNPFRYRVLRPLLIWLGYTACTCLLCHDRALAFSMWLRLAYWGLCFVFFFVVAAKETDRAKQLPGSGPQNLWKAGVVAGAIFGSSVLLAKALGKGGEYYGVGESYGFYADPWNMAMTLPGVLAVTLPYPMLFAGGIGSRARGYLLVALTVVASFLTFTRTSLIACVFGILLFTFAVDRVASSRRTRAMVGITLLVIVFVVAVLARNVAGGNSSQVSARWSELDKGEIGSGRLEVFYAGWSKFVNASPARKLIGHGLGAGPEAAEEFMGVYVFLHDDVLEMLVCAGLVGVGLYGWMFVRFYRDVLSGLRSRNLWAVAGLVAIAVYNVTSISYMRLYAVTPNTYFALAAGTSLGMLHASKRERDNPTLHEVPCCS